MSAYLLANIEIHDAEHFADYGRQVPPFVAKHGGRYLVRGGAATQHEGEPQAGRVVVIVFPSRADAEAFLNDPDYAPVAAIRHASSTSHVTIVDGVPE